MKDAAGHLRTFAAALAAVALLSDCGGGGGYGDGGGGGSGTYTIGGTVSGLSGTLVLQDNGGDNRTITVDGPFTFATALPYLASYNVTVLTQPANQSCTVSNGTGTVGLANVTNVAVNCVFVPVLGDLVITEVMAQPAGGSPATKEWFEVFNTSPNALQLDGMVVTVNTTSTFTVPAGVSMPSGAYFVFASSSNIADNAMLPVVNVDYGTALPLTNTNLTLSLGLGATTLDTVVFTTSTSGRSLSLDPTTQDPTANDNIAANWCLATTAYGDGTNQGTPGAAGATCP